MKYESRYKGKERRRNVQLSDEQFEAIAKRAAEIGKKDIYAEIGEGIFKRVLWLLGIGGSALGGYFTYKGLK